MTNKLLNFELLSTDQQTAEDVCRALLVVFQIAAEAHHLGQQLHQFQLKIGTRCNRRPSDVGHHGQYLQAHVVDKTVRVNVLLQIKKNATSD